MILLRCLKRSAAMLALAIMLSGVAAPAFGITFNIPKQSKVRATSPELGEVVYEVEGPSTAVISGPRNQNVRFVDMYLRGDDRTLGTITMTLHPTQTSAGTLSPLDEKRSSRFPMVHRQSFYVVVRASALGPDSLISNTPVQMEGTIPSFTPAHVKYRMVGPPVDFYKRGDAGQTTVLTIADVQTDVSNISEVPARPDRSHPDASWYVSAHRIDDFEDLASEVFSGLEPQPVRNSPAFGTPRVDSETQAGIGAALRLRDWLALDLGLAAGTGTASRTAEAHDQGGVEASQDADFRIFGASLAARLYPWRTERVQPWLSAGVRGLALRPTGGSETNGEERRPVPRQDLQPASTADFLAGAGVDVHLTDWLGLTFSGEHGFGTGWRAGAALTFPFPGRRPAAEERPPQREGAMARPILKFRWHGSGNSCDTPLGICLSIPIGLADHALSPAEIADGFGTADFQVEGDRLRMEFHREAALPDGTIRIDQDKLLEPALAAALGYENIRIKRGVYRVDLSKEPFGQAMVDIVKGPPVRSLIDDPDVPASATWRAVNCLRYANTTGSCKGCGVACDDGTNYPMSCGADLFSDITRGCGGVHISFDPTFGTAEVYKGHFSHASSPVFTQNEVGIVETFDTQGRENSCLSSQTGQQTAFTRIVPRRTSTPEP